MNGDIDSVNHVGVAVRDLERASSLYEAMGFTLTPLSVHSGSAKPGDPVEPMATGNRCAVFPNNYVEVLGIVNPGKLDWGWSRFIERFQGAHIICFGCQDAATVDGRVKGTGIGTSGVLRLQRDVETGEGMRTARFDCVHFEGDRTPEGLIQAARHLDPEYIHQPRYLDHRNGATDLAEVVLLTVDPADTAGRYEALTGRKASGPDRSIQLPLATRLRFLGPAEIEAEFPGTLFTPPPSIVAMGFSVRDLDETGRVLTRGGFTVERSQGRVMVPAEEALGVVHYFQAA